MTNDKFKTRIFTLVVEKALNYIIHIKKIYPATASSITPILFRNELLQ